MLILAYAFTHNKHLNISSEILSDLKCENKFYIDCKTTDIAIRDTELMLNEISRLNPDLILGMGHYSGRDKSHLRLEQICKNKFRDIILGETTEYYFGDYFKDKFDPEYFKLAYAMGNSFCNLSCYKISEVIEKNNLNSKLCFVHIPKSFDLAQKHIQSLITPLERGLRGVT